MSSQLLSLLGSAALQGSIFFCFVAAISLAFRRLSASWKCWLWRSVPLKFLIGLGLTVSIPVSGPIMHRIAFGTDAAARAVARPGASVLKQPAQSPEVSGPEPAVAASASPVPTEEICLAIWVLGVAFVLVRDLSAWNRVRGLLKDSSAAPPSETLQVFGIGSLLAGLRLRTVPHLDAPALVGVFRPTVLLPANYAELSPGALSSGMAHELAHLKRKDLGWIVCAEVAKALFWFDPLTWIACREQLTESEIAADDMARKWTGASTKAYAEHLLEWIDMPAAGQISFRAQPGLLLSTHELTKRMKAMSVNRLTRSTTVAIGAVLALPLALGLAPLKLVGIEGGSLASTSWPKARANLQNTGRGGGSGAVGKKLWAFTTGDQIESSPTIGSNGMIYIGSYDGKLYAIDKSTGQEKWHLKTGLTTQKGPLVTGTPTVGADGTVYEGGQDGNVYAVDGTTGAVKWSYMVASYVYPAPTLAPDGTLYVGCGDGNMYAVDSATGMKKWSYKTGDNITSEAAIGKDGTLYFGSHDGKLYALNGKTGILKWSFKTGDAVGNSPGIGQDGTVYFGSWDHSVYALDGATGAKKWSYATGDQVFACPAIADDGTVYIGSNDGNLYAFNGATGAKKWTFRTGGQVFSSPAIGSDGTVYFGSWDQKVYAVDGATGAKKWALKTGGMILSSPSIDADGTIYIGSWDHKVYAIR